MTRERERSEATASNIVLFSDGTGNSAGKLFKTNVWRLYQALDFPGPDAATPQKPEQIAYYDDGVGTSSFKPLAVLGGAFGWGLKRNVLDLYTFLCRNYRPGDRIYSFGFSRGAFTMRVLAGLLNHQGLVRADSRSEAELRRLALGAFRSYRSKRYTTQCRLERPARLLRQALIASKNRLLGLETYQPQCRPADLSITFLGLWDTVAAYGLPIDELTRAWNALFPLSAGDRELSACVERACHVLALDDERNTFHPVLWNEAGCNTDTTHIQEERLTQVWFTGMHSNVGGGYPDDALAHVSLDWMMGEAHRLGLAFKEDDWKRIKATADVCGRLYDSRHGLGGTYRYLPRKLAVLTQDVADPKRPVRIERPKIHESVFKRIAQGVDSYAPFVLPARYAVVTAAGQIIDPPPVPGPGNPSGIEPATQAASRVQRQEQVWNLVWCKRVAYFTSILVAALLVAFPLYRPATVACEGRLCALSSAVSGLGWLLPGMAAPWLAAYQSHPGTFSVLALVLIALIWTSSRLQVWIFDTMRAIWHPSPASLVLPRRGWRVPYTRGSSGCVAIRSTSVFSPCCSGGSYLLSRVWPLHCWSWGDSARASLRC